MMNPLNSMSFFCFLRILSRLIIHTRNTEIQNLIDTGCSDSSFVNRMKNDARGNDLALLLPIL